MPQRRRKPASPLRQHQARSFNFASGIIYVGAAIASIALGAIFYKGYTSAKQIARANESPSQNLSMDLPPGARVVTKSGQQRIVTKPKPGRPPAGSQANPTEELEANPPLRESDQAPEPEEDSTLEEHPPLEPNGFPSLKTPLPTPWSAGYEELTETQTARLTPTAAVAGSTLSSKETAADLPLKGNENFILTQYDISNLRGWTIKRATWHGRITRGSVRDLSFSTILADWDPITGRFLVSGTNRPAAKAALPDDAALPWDGWYFFRGNGSSLIFCSKPAETNNAPGEWISVELDPKIVQALVAGASYGIAICDEKGQSQQLAAIAGTNDADSCSFIEVEGGLADIIPPGEVSHLKAWAHPDLSHPDRVGALLTWTATGDNAKKGHAFRYDIRHTTNSAVFSMAETLPLHAIPFPQPSGQRDQVVIDHLKPDTDYTFYIRVMDESGQPGPIGKTSLRTAGLLQLPTAKQPNLYDAAAIEVASRAVSLWVVDEATAVNPISGQIAQPLQEEAELSPIWNRSSRTLTLRAAKNETLGFQLILGRKEAAFPALQIDAEAFRNAQGELIEADFAFYRMWYSVSAPVRGTRNVYGDGLTPLKGPVKMPWADNPIPNQAYQSVYAEIHVPADVSEGLYRTQIILTAPNGTKDAINVLLTVLPAAIPAKPSFACELLIPPGIASQYRKNALNAAAAFPVEQGYRELAAAHRCAASSIPYSGGQCPTPFSPPVVGKGQDIRVTSWVEWDERFAGAITNSVTAFHTLPIFESWPTTFREGYVCFNSDLRPAGNGPLVFGGEAETLEACMSTPYWRAFRSLVQQFGEHFKTSGWNGLRAGIWLVNEPSTGFVGRTLAWSLGHPLYRDDFLALDAFARVAGGEASASWSPDLFAFRVSIPDAGLLGHQGGPRFQLLSASDPSIRGWEALRQRAALYNAQLWFESETLPLVHQPIAAESIGIGYFLEGADGWTIREAAGIAENWTRARDPSLLYCGFPLGQEQPYPSLRLKMLRRTQQDIELLKLLQVQMGWTRLQLKDFVTSFLSPLKGGADHAQNWSLLRQAVLDLLAKNE